MDTILVACKTIEDEIMTALERWGLDYPVIWLEGGLHNNPEHLRTRIQEIFDTVRCRKLLISLGYCGGGVCGLTTGNYQTVLPMADDCLSLLLGSMEARRLASRPVTYFLTAGWLRYENNIITTYQQSVEKFGKRQADRINRLMFKHYRRIGLVKTGCYDLAVIADRVGPLAETLELTVESLEGDDDWLKELLLGPCLDSDRFLVVGPNSTICFDAWSKLLMGSDPVSSSSQLCQEALPASP